MSFKKKEENIEINQDKFISFFKYSILQKDERKRFFLVYSNKVADPRDYRKN
jgi:hypothetical protein